MASLDVGVGLWALRSTATSPAHFGLLYRELQEDARLAEELGLHSLWLSEHHFWYDGWCPALLVAAASALGATTRLNIGTGVLVVPLHDPARLVQAAATLERLAPGRFELGVGVGYREAELDGLGISRRTRGRRVDEALDVLADGWAGGPRIWIGGIAERSLRRASDRGHSLLLPSSMRARQVREVVDRARDAAAAAGVALGRVGMLKNAWVTDGSQAERRAMQERIAAGTREYAGAWWLLKGRLGFDVPELLEAQIGRAAETALVGPPELIADGLRELAGVGIEFVVLHVSADLTRPAYRENMRRIATDVLPALA